MQIRRFHQVLGIAVLLGVSTLAAQQANRLDARVAAIAAAEDTAGRRQAIAADLRASGVEPRFEEFSAQNQTGTNIVATIPARTPSRTLLVGAHYDRVQAGRGVVDNGASCAVLLALAAQLKARPLERHSVSLVFFDLEEIGLHGSRAHLEKAGPGALPNAAVNLDVFAYGDTLFATATPAEGLLARAFQDAARDVSLPVKLTDRYPPSDHQSMIAAGIETVSLSLLDGPEIDAIITPPPRTGGTPPAPPRVFTIIHSPGDALDKLRAADVEKAAPVVERMIRLFDERATP